MSKYCNTHLASATLICQSLSFHEQLSREDQNLKQPSPSLKAAQMPRLTWTLSSRLLDQQNWPIAATILGNPTDGYPRGFSRLKCAWRISSHKTTCASWIDLQKGPVIMGIQACSNVAYNSLTSFSTSVMGKLWQRGSTNTSVSLQPLWYGFVQEFGIPKRHPWISWYHHFHPQRFKTLPTFLFRKKGLPPRPVPDLQPSVNRQEERQRQEGVTQVTEIPKGQWGGWRGGWLYEGREKRNNHCG